MPAFIANNWLKITSAMIMLVIFYFAIFVIKPFDSTPDNNPETADEAWNSAISRLGISPIFPPQEDFYVGDVWAVIVEAGNTPLLGRSVRIGNLDLLADARSSKNPIFPDTAEKSKDQDYIRQSRIEIDDNATDGKIKLTLTAFPGVSITKTISKKASFAAKFLNLSSGREESIVEEIRIPVAETYGVPFGKAVGAFSLWCKDKNTQLFCNEAYIRRILAYAVGDDLLKNNDIKIQINVITRVFLMRRIEQRRRIGGSRGISSDFNPLFFSQGTPTTGSANAAGIGSSAASDQPAADSLSASQSGGVKSLLAADATRNRLALTNDDSAEIGIQQTFQRPLAFGFRSVTIRLESNNASTK